VVAGEDRATRLVDRVNASFELEYLRPMAQADMAASDERGMDFGRFVDVSVLPLLLSEAREAGIGCASCVFFAARSGRQRRTMWRGLTMSPWQTTLADRQVGGYPFFSGVHVFIAALGA